MPTMLHCVGLPVPEQVDGATLVYALEAGFMSANPVVQTAGQATATASHDGPYSEDEPDQTD